MVTRTARNHGTQPGKRPPEGVFDMVRRRSPDHAEAARGPGMVTRTTRNHGTQPGKGAPEGVFEIGRASGRERVLS